MNKHLKEYIKKYLPMVLINALNKIRYFLKYRSWDMFSIIFIETITACNRRCSYCPNSKFDRGAMENMRKMKTELFYKIIDELSKLRWKGQIQPHFYGEPLLDDRLLLFIKYIGKKLPSSNIALFTNGDLLTLDLYKELIAQGVSQFYITQHSKEKQDNIQNILDYRKEHGDNDILLSYCKLENIYNRGGLVGVRGEERIERCDLPSYMMGIGYKGDILLCCNDYLSTVNLGNINNEKIIDIWKKPYYKNLRREVKKGIFRLGVCKACKQGKNG